MFYKIVEHNRKVLIVTTKDIDIPGTLCVQVNVGNHLKPFQCQITYEDGTYQLGTIKTIDNGFVKKAIRERRHSLYRKHSSIQDRFFAELQNENEDVDPRFKIMIVLTPLPKHKR